MKDKNKIRLTGNIPTERFYQILETVAVLKVIGYKILSENVLHNKNDVDFDYYFKFDE